LAAFLDGAWCNSWTEWGIAQFDEIEMLVRHEIRDRSPRRVSDCALRQPQIAPEQADRIVLGETLGVANDIGGKFWTVDDVVEDELSVGVGGGEVRIRRCLDV
jgi:hypothetical protein